MSVEFSNLFAHLLSFLLTHSFIYSFIHLFSYSFQSMCYWSMIFSHDLSLPLSEVAFFLWWGAGVVQEGA